MNFIVLTREYSPQAANLYRVLGSFGDVRVVEDQGEAPSGFREMCTENICGHDRVTAWDRAFIDIEVETTWFIEDDVAGPRDVFARLFEALQDDGRDLLANHFMSQQDPGAENWNWWYKNWAFAEPRKTFNPLCRLSGELIEQVLRFRKRHGKFCFHEIMFASLARSIGDLDRMFPEIFRDFRYRPMHEKILPEYRDRILHPVKDAHLHGLVCSEGAAHRESRLLVRNPNFRVEDAFGKCILRNQQTGATYEMTDSATAVWNLLDTYDDAREIAEVIREHVHGAPGRIHEDIAELIDTFECIGALAVERSTGTGQSPVPLEPHGPDSQGSYSRGNPT